MINTIWLIRHGETNENAARILQTPDAALSGKGQEQAQALARRLKESPVTDVLHSDMLRAKQTALAVIAATGAQGHESARLRERNFGDLRGKSYQSVGEDFFAEDYQPPGGESWHQFYDRVDLAWETILHRANLAKGDLAVVTHGLVCMAIVARHTRLEGSQILPEKFGNTSVTLIENTAPYKVSLLDSTTHLLPVQSSQNSGAV